MGRSFAHIPSNPARQAQLYFTQGRNDSSERLHNLPKIIQLMEAGTGSKSSSGSKAHVFPPHEASAVLLTVWSEGSSPVQEGKGSPDKLGASGVTQEGS